MSFKIDKKILVISVVVLVIVVLIGIVANQDNAQVEIKDVSGQGNDDGFSICLDKCGDSICQQSDPDCTDSSKMNCICPETKEECPQDCTQ